MVMRQTLIERETIRNSLRLLGNAANGRLPLEGRLRRRRGEVRNPPLPVADEGGCSANEATSFVSVSAQNDYAELRGVRSGLVTRKCQQQFKADVASMVLISPVLTAIAWPTPHHRLRRSLPSRGSLLVAVFSFNRKLLHI